ncbi:MOSC N-terminal beta barrel domain-containing protein [soil metagenome]
MQYFDISVNSLKATMITVVQLHVYPVKSMQGISLDTAELTVRGLKYDRNWMVVEENGTFLTQRRLPRMASIRVSISDDYLKFTNSSGDSIEISLHNKTQKEVSVNVWADYCEALDEGDEISEWLTTELNYPEEKPIRLVRFKETFRRETDQRYLKGEDSTTAFADGFPFLVASVDSLQELNDRLMSTGASAVDMNRFRPNIVIKGMQPFYENNIDYLASSAGNYKLGIRKPCKRCKVTTVDQTSGIIAEPREPLRTLAHMKTARGLNGAYFGQNSTLVFGKGNFIKVDDTLVAG